MTYTRRFAPYSMLLLVFLWALPASAQRVKTVKETVALDARGELTIDTYKGSVTVETWDRNEVQIDVRIEADEDRELVEDTEIRIQGSGQRVRVETDYEEAKRRHRRGIFGNSYSLPYVHYTIKMPRTAQLRIDDYKSEIQVTNLAADLDIETYKGIVDIERLAGSLRLETYKGRARVAFSDLADDSSFDTYKGEIDIYLPANTGLTLDADMGRKGDLDTDFSLSRLHRSENNYRGEVNGGGPRISLDTYKGNFRIVTR